VSVERYRCLKSFELEPAKMNILIGRNNAGKSTALEAIVIAATSSTGYIDARGEDILMHIAARHNWELGYFVDIGSTDAKLSITRPIDGVSTESTVELSYLKRGFPKDEKLAELIKENALERAQQDYRRRRARIVADRPRVMSDEQLREELERVEAQTTAEIFARGKLVLANPSANRIDVLLEGKYEHEVVRSSPGVSTGVLFSGPGIEITLKNLHDSLLPTARFSSVMDSIREAIPYVADIRTLQDRILVYLRDTDRPIPIELMGDGFREVLRIAFITALTRGGAIFLEEPENHLHPGFMELVSSFLVDSAKDKETQLFISTHSMEFLNHLLEKFENDIRVVRMYRVDSTIDFEVMNGKEALEESKESGFDLRGI
jgi:ABC-type polar amino acid transport system ATPase subunit